MRIIIIFRSSQMRILTSTIVLVHWTAWHQFNEATSVFCLGNCCTTPAGGCGCYISLFGSYTLLEGACFFIQAITGAFLLDVRRVLPSDPRIRLMSYIATGREEAVLQNGLNRQLPQSHFMEVLYGKKAFMCQSTWCMQDALYRPHYSIQLTYSLYQAEQNPAV